MRRRCLPFFHEYGMDKIFGEGDIGRYQLAAYGLQCMRCHKKAIEWFKRPHWVPVSVHKEIKGWLLETQQNGERE